MQKLCAIILLTTLVANNEGVTQTKWSRPIRNTQSEYKRDRRQFSFGEWIPLTKPCPTCRPLVDPLDVGQRTEGLVPPRPSTVTRQIHGEGNFFGQDDSAVLSVPPPPPSLSRNPLASSNGNFQFQNLGPFNNPLSISSPTIFPQTQPIQFLHQPFLPNQNLLVNSNQPLLPVLPTSNGVFSSESQAGQFVRDEKLANFDSNFGPQKFTENVILEQNVRQFSGNAQPGSFSNKPTSFPKQQPLLQHSSNQGFGQQVVQQHHSVVHHPQPLQQQHQRQPIVQQQNQHQRPQQQLQQQQPQRNPPKADDSILTPPPVQNNTASNIVIPGLDKEEIQLLYVPVETLRQRGNLQQQYLLQQQQQQQQHQLRLQQNQQHQQQQNQQQQQHLQQQHQHQQQHLQQQQLHQQQHLQQQQQHQIQQQHQQQRQQQSVQLQNGLNTATRSSSTPRPTEFTSSPGQSLKGHFVTENTLTHGQTLNSNKFSSSHPFSTVSTPSTVFFGNLHTQQAPQAFVSATPVTTTEPSFITPSPFTQNLVSLTPETTLPHLSTLQNTIPYTTPDFPFVTTPKNVITEEGLREEIITGKPQFDNVETQKYQQHFTYQPYQPNNVHLQSFSTLQREKINQEQNAEKHQNQEIKDHQQFNSQKTPVLSQQEIQENELREQYLLKERRQKELEAQRQNALQEQRFLQKQQKQQEVEEQRRKEYEQEKYLQQSREKEIEEQRLLHAQRQKEGEEEEIYQQRRQNQLEEQRRQQRLREAEEKRLQHQRQKVEDEREQVQWQQQQKKGLNDQRLLQQQQNEYENVRGQQQYNDNRFAYVKQKDDDLKKQQFYQQKQQQQILQQVHQVQHQQQQQQQQQNGNNKNSFSDVDNSNYISEAEKETETESPLVPHQPPLSVFYKGYGKGEPRIVDVLRELRSSRAITVLDQYFEKMPKVFVGPAGLVPPTGYDKFDLPYLSNIESRLMENQREKLPFFVAPLNFVPPTGYSKIPFPSPHVGSVVISSDSITAATVKPTEATTSSEEGEGNYGLVGPELPGLINSLETESTTIKSTTPSLPQTTAQLRGRRPSSTLYRTRKPVSRTRSTTTTTTSRPEEVTQEKSDESDSGFRKPFNRFLKRRRPVVKSTTENIVEQQTTEKRPTQNRFYSSQTNRKQFGDVAAGNRKYTSQSTPLNADDETRIRSNSGTYRLPQTGTVALSRDRGQKPSEENENTLQSEEEGPYPTGSAKTITQELYRPNELRTKTNRYPENLRPKETKLEPKVDTSTTSGILFDGSEQTQFSEESEVNPTVGYLKSADQKSGEISNEYTTNEFDGEKQYTLVPTPLNFDQTEYPRTESPLPLSSPQVIGQQRPTTEYFGLDDRYTSAFAEISKHHHIPSPQEPGKQVYDTKYSSEERPAGISIELQAPFSDGFSQEFSVEGQANIKQIDGAQYSEEYGPSGSSSDEYSASPEEINGNNFSVRPTASGVVSSQYADYPQTSSNSAKTVSGITGPTTTEPTYYSNIQETPVTPLYFQGIRYNPTSTEFSSQEYGFNTVKSRDIDEVPTTLPSISKEVSESSINKQTSEESDVSEGKKQTTNTDFAINVSRDKFSNPSIVRIRTRVRGKQRGQTQNTTSAPATVRTVTESQKKKENTDKEVSGKPSYQPGVSKYNFRGFKKPLRPTLEPITESEQKGNVFTVKPHRRPTNPSTVSTKRIRRPTTPLPTEESPSEDNTYSPQTYSSQEPEYPSSGVSNDVYYEHASYSPLSRPKYRKTYNPREQKVEVTPILRSTTAQTFFYGDSDSSSSQGDEYSREYEAKVEEDTSEEESLPQRGSTESEANSFRTVLTTARTTSLNKEAESAEVKKTQENKKAFDPDLEKKSGRRRVRVRVNKRPHENFETAESQNLRTVANVLVPATSTYKPIDESNLPLAKNSETNYEGGQKSFGSRSREYFKKRFNLTLPDGNSTQQSTGFANQPTGEYFIKSTGEKVYRINGEEVEGGKGFRPKFRGYVRKVIKHPADRKEGEQTIEVKNFERQRQSTESLKNDKTAQGIFNQTGRLGGPRHKTLVRYIKKNRVKTQEIESKEKEVEEAQTESTLSVHHNGPTEQREEESESAEDQSPSTEKQETEVENNEHAEYTTTEYPETQQTEEPEPFSTENYVTEGKQDSEEESAESQETEEPEVQTTPTIDTVQPTVFSPIRPSQHPLFGKGATKLYPVTYQQSKESEEPEVQSSKATEATLVKTTETKVAYKNKFYQTLRPVYQRAPNSGILRIRDQPTSSTTELSTPEQAEKKTRYNKYKYGKVSSYGSSGTSQNNDRKESNEQQSVNQNKNKNIYNPEVRKYTRGGSKTREGGFGQYNRNRYSTYSKAQSTSTPKHESDEESEEVAVSSFEYESTTPYVSTENEADSTTESFRTSDGSEEEESAELTTRYPPTRSEADSEIDDLDDFLTTEKSETTVNDKVTDFLTTLYQITGFQNSDSSTTTEDSSVIQTVLPSKASSKAERTTTKSSGNTQPDLYRFAKNSFSFDENFTGTKNRAYVRNITADILENTSSFSAPGVEQRNEIIVSSSDSAGGPSQTTTEKSETEASTSYDKTDAFDSITEVTTEEQTTDSAPTTTETINANEVAQKAVDKKTIVNVSVSGGEEASKGKVSKLLKTSTTTKISHETEICYRGRCIRTKSENPDEDLKQLVDSASPAAAAVASNKENKTT